MAGKDTLNKLKIKEREIRRNLIMDAAERVFSTRAFDRVSMREIAEEAGIATSSIYTYFSNQEELFLESAIREINTLMNSFREVMETNISDEEKLEGVIKGFIDYISINDSYFRMMVLFMTQGNLNQESLDSLNTIMRQAFSLFDELLKNLSYKGNLRQLSHFFFATLNGILVTYRKLPGRSEEQVIEYMKTLGQILKDHIITCSKEAE